MNNRQVFRLVGAASFAASFAALGAAGAQQKHPMTFEEFSSLRSVSDPQVSPDGKSVIYAVRTTDITANKRATRSYIIATAGGNPRTFPDDKTMATEARWSPDGSRVVYVSGGQLWISEPGGANPKKLTELTGGASGPVWSPAGDRVAFVSGVYPDCGDEACNAARAKAADESKVKAHVTESLLFRHWNVYDDGTRSHLFVVKPDGGDLRDLTPHAKYDVPPGPFGGSEGYSFSPDGREVAYTAKDQGRADAWSTDLNVYTVPATGGAATTITAASKGADQNPVYTPDGKAILYASQARAGFESDRWRLMAYDRATRASREILTGFDRWANAYLPLPDSKSVLISTDEHARNVLYRAALGAAAAKATRLPTAGNVTAPTLSRDGKTLVFLRDAVDHPPEVWTATVGDQGLAGAHAITHETDAAITAFGLHGAEDFVYTGGAGDSVHGFLIKPPQYEAGKKFPLLLLIHGGPQGAWYDAWGSRWAPQMFAAGGYAVVMINPHGSTGYGQKFVDGVTKDWGGKTYTDLMRGVDVVLKNNPWIDSTRMGAAGGSYGGYMANWLEGHTTRFKAIASHAGVFNLEAMAGATEELWFTDWEFGGGWWNERAMGEQYRKFSPHLFAQNFKTPMLVIHGELDYRVPYTEGLSLFTALQRHNVPSRMVVFPDEGHWIGKPQNAQLWWKEMHAWFGKYLGTRPSM